MSGLDVDGTPLNADSRATRAAAAWLADRKASAQFATATRERKADGGGSVWYPGPAPAKADGGGLRDDAGKTRFELLPFDALESVARVLTKGAAKYEARNWERGMSWQKCVGCLMRHLVARLSGEKLDKESGELHTAHLVTNAMFLLTYEIRKIGTDDLTDPKSA